MAGKARVHELAKELGVTSKELLATLKEQGEFVKSASSTVEAPVARRLRETFGAKSGATKTDEKPRGQGGNGASAPAAPKPGAPAPSPATAAKPAAPKPAAPQPPAAPATPAAPAAEATPAAPAKPSAPKPAAPQPAAPSADRKSVV